MIFAKKVNPDLESFATMLKDSIVNMFQKRGDVRFSSEPLVERKKIFEYEGRLRVDGMEKFENEATYISAVNYYASEKEMEKHLALGAIVIYVKQEYLAPMLKMLKYPPIDEDNDDELRDSCGTLCNIIAGQFKSQIASAGYIELEMSHFINFRNSSFGGVEFCESEYEKYEMSFELKNAKQMVVEMTMGIVPKR